METRSRKRRQVTARDLMPICKRRRKSVTKARTRFGLEDLPAEILEQILLDSAELCLIHTSSRLHAILPSYRRWAKGFLLVCFLQQKRAKGTWNWHSANKAKRWTVPGLQTPLSDAQRLLLQRKVLNSHWFGLLPLATVMFDLIHINICEIIGTYDLSVANSVKINHLFANITSLALGETFTMNAVRPDSELEYRISVPNGFVVEEYCDEYMTCYLRPVFDILHIPDKLLQPPFTKDNTVLLCFLRRAWEPCLRRGATLDFNRELLHSSILATIRQEEPINNTSEYIKSKAETFVMHEIQLLILLLELEVTGLAHGYKQCIKDAYFEAAIFGGKLKCLDVLITMDPCWPRKIKIKNMVKRNLAEKPFEKLPREVAQFVNENRDELTRQKLKDWPRKGRCGSARHDVAKVIFGIDNGLGHY